jgi:hypothetical protein
MESDELPPVLSGLMLPDWAAWLAQDEDGTWWAYEAEPNQQHNGWYENEVGRIVRLARTDPPADWRATLTPARRSPVSAR